MSQQSTPVPGRSGVSTVSVSTLTTPITGIPAGSRRGLDEVITVGGLIASGGMGSIHSASNLNPFALMVELVINGELAPHWVGIDDIPFEEPGGGENLPEPIANPALVSRVYAAGDRLRAEYVDLVRNDPAKAQRILDDLLAAINPRLRENPPIAVKLFQPKIEDADDDTRRRLIKDFTRRFIQENHLLRLLDHPNIVSRFGLVYDPERGWCLLLSCIDGENLEQRLGSQPGGRLPLDEAARIGVELAEALQHIHAKKIVHRDLKPSNIMIDRGGRAIITDFGIGKWEGTGQTRSGLIVGTPDYMAPEQLEGIGTPATDIYQLGAVLFRMVTGQRPYEGIERNAMLLQLGRPEVGHPTNVSDLRPDISPEFETIIEKARDKKASQRWTAEEVVVELRALQRPEGKSARVDLPAMRRRLKAISWERTRLEEQIQALELEARAGEIEVMASEVGPGAALTALEALARDVQGQSAARFNALKARIAANQQEWSRQLAGDEARSKAAGRVREAEALWEAGDYAACSAALKEIGPELAILGDAAEAGLAERHRILAERIHPHESVVDMFHALRRSADGIIARSAAPIPDPAHAEMLLKDMSTAAGMLKTIDRTRIGPAYGRTLKDLVKAWCKIRDVVEQQGTPMHFDTADARTTNKSLLAQCGLTLESLLSAPG